MLHLRTTNDTKINYDSPSPSEEYQPPLKKVRFDPEDCLKSENNEHFSQIFTGDIKKYDTKSTLLEKKLTQLDLQSSREEVESFSDWWDVFDDALMIRSHSNKKRLKMP